ncbi:MAG TPA: serine/threonine-protein kinase [Bryobacteraceae bacterium]|nr:serine/threonine-protein kinase [Bryobacteraceae bacterium]
MGFLPDRTLDHLRQVTEAPDLSGTRYEIEEEIGRGGMGTVYRARDTQLDRSVALKVMDSRGAIVDEAKVLAQLEHPGLVPVYDAGTLPDGRAYYAMRLVRGKRLDEFAAHEPSLPARLRVFEKICEAVAFAHDRGVVHCDLKPQNVMAGSFGEVFVMDWGVARVAGSGAAAGAGTPAYMAPEQARAGSHPVDCRADVFALGRILAGLMAPEPPRPLAAVSRKAAAADPADRYAAVEQLAADVTRFLDGLPVSAYRESTLEKLGRYYRRNQVLLLLLGVYFAVKLFLFFLARH